MWFTDVSNHELIAYFGTVGALYCTGFSVIAQSLVGSPKLLVDAVLDAQLMATALAKAVIDVCEEWSRELPPLFCAKNRPVFSVHTMKNNRRRMEDRYAMCVDVNSLFGLEV